MSDQSKPTTAPEFLAQAGAIMAQRAAQYDQPGGERSMGRTVEAFNIITGHKLREEDGWLLMQILKDVRQWQTPGAFHRDSAEDGVAYSALKAEALARGETCEHAHTNFRKKSNAAGDVEEYCLSCGAAWPIVP